MHVHEKELLRGEADILRIAQVLVRRKYDENNRQKCAANEYLQAYPFSHKRTIGQDVSISDCRLRNCAEI